MRIRWRNLELPTRVVTEEATAVYGRFNAEPFERGFGTTVGNGLRRVLLSSIEGSAITTVKIKGVLHEFTALPHMVEDMTDVILNLKQVLVRLHRDGDVTLRIERNTKGAVTGADVICDPGAEIVNPELHIATLAEDGEFYCELTARRGRGYATAEENTGEEQEIGVIPIDAIFSPVLRVRYRTENTRVGKVTTYDKLILEIWTDGTISPADALVEASKIYRKHLNPFVQHGMPGAEVVAAAVPQEPEFELPEPVPQEQLELRDRMALPISDLDLSVRASNCLEVENVRTIGDLVRLSEADLLNFKNFGQTSLREVQQKLIGTGLALEMDVEALVAQGGAESEE
ncbi:MAG: DNA-directed RNA polymerase subunit alpha [Planctomycetota bacterium]|nr:DNA-directed RNA polymerase subunit alpha [Planctomycetota bacterium]